MAVVILVKCCFSEAICVCACRTDQVLCK